MTTEPYITYLLLLYLPCTAQSIIQFNSKAIDYIDRFEEKFNLHSRKDQSVKIIYSATENDAKSETMSKIQVLKISTRLRNPPTGLYQFQMPLEDDISDFLIFLALFHLNPSGMLMLVL